MSSWNRLVIRFSSLPATARIPLRLWVVCGGGTGDSRDQRGYLTAGGAGAAHGVGALRLYIVSII